MAEIAGLILAGVIVWTVGPMFARIVGAGMFLVGLFGARSSATWAGWTIAIGVILWLAGSWLHTVKTGHYSSRLARTFFERTPLKWTLPQHRTSRAMTR